MKCTQPEIGLPPGSLRSDHLQPVFLYARQLLL